MYLLGGVGGHRFQQRLWRARSSGRIVLLNLTDLEAERMDSLMTRYADLPMDLADASIVAVAENRSLRQVFTVDNDFFIYRLGDGSVLEVVK
jgi:predicted nucleic acid-binding protein